MKLFLGLFFSALAGPQENFKQYIEYEFFSLNTLIGQMLNFCESWTRNGFETIPISAGMTG